MAVPKKKRSKQRNKKRFYFNTSLSRKGIKFLDSFLYLKPHFYFCIWDPRYVWSNRK